MQKFQLYLFDFDGTLFDTLESLYPTFRYGFDAIGVTVTDEEIEEFTHHSLQEAVKMKGLKKEDVPLFAQKIIEALDFDEYINFM